MINGVFSQYGLAGIFGALLVVGVATEQLIPRRTHLRFCRLYEKTIALHERTIAERERQIDILLGRPTADPRTDGAGVGSQGTPS